MILLRLLALCFGLLAPAAVMAQDQGDLIGPPAPDAPAEVAPALDYDAWMRTAQRTETISENQRGSAFALERLRADLVIWRDRFVVETQINAARIVTVQAQIAALGAAPAEGSEDPRVSARRAALDDQMARLRAPIQLAEEAYAHADGLIGEVDRLIRARQANELTTRAASPLDPRGWPEVAEGVRTRALGLWKEVTVSVQSPARLQTLARGWPTVLLFLAIGLALLLRGRRWMRALDASLAQGGAQGVSVWRFLLSLGQVALPMGGIVALTAAIESSGMFGLRASTIAAAAATAGLFVLVTRWLAGQFFNSSRVNPAPFDFGERRKAEGARLLGRLGWALGLAAVALAFLQTGDMTPVLKAGVFLPFELGLAYLLFRFGRLLARASAPGVAPGLGPGLAPGVAPGLGPGLAPGVAPGLALVVDPGATPGTAPGVAARAAARVAAGVALMVDPGATPGTVPGVAARAAARVAAGVALEAVEGAAASDAMRFSRRLLMLLGRAAMAVAIAVPVLSVLGFARASEALLYPAILSLGLAGGIILLQWLVYDVWTLIFRAQDGARDALAPVLIGFAMILAALPPMALIWGARWEDLAEIWTAFQEGFAMGESRVSPSDFASFILVFGIGYMLTRLVQSTLRTTVLPKTRLDIGGQNAIVSGLGYLGIFLSALFAITFAGLDLSNLAIVAGALSVGIGFGLQNIVSNFVAGIILLIERPISQGDWIEVGGRMGYVRDISVRSTRIETFDRTDVIVPNADLVSGQVVNWTRGSSVGRVIAPVSVMFGPDVEQVLLILREVAEAHPMVLLSPPPTVILQNFGTDIMNFEIRAIVRDVNFGLIVRSEMNVEIAKRFYAEGIEFAGGARANASAGRTAHSPAAAAAVPPVVIMHAQGVSPAYLPVPASPPDDAAPDDATPDDATPDDATPDDARPDDARPKAPTPDDATPDDATPDDAMPKAPAPKAPAPEAPAS